MSLEGGVRETIISDLLDLGGFIIFRVDEAIGYIDCLLTDVKILHCAASNGTCAIPTLEGCKKNVVFGSNTLR